MRCDVAVKQWGIGETRQAISTWPEWANVNERVVDLRDHLNTTGAVVQTTVFQALLDSLDPGSTVYNPPGAIINLNAEIDVEKKLRFSGPGEYRFTAGMDNARGFHVTADGCVFDGVTVTNPNELGAQTGGTASFAIYAAANDLMVVGSTIDSWQSGIGVSALGEWHNIIITGNRIKDILGAGDGPSDTVSSYGEDRGDGITVWGAAATIANNVVNCKEGHDALVGIHVEALTDYEVTPWMHSDALAAITGNVVYGQFRRGIVNEEVHHVAILGNVIADATQWAIGLMGDTNGSTVVGNNIKWTRTSADLQGDAWAPFRAPIGTANDPQYSLIAENTIVHVAGSAAEATIFLSTQANNMTIRGNLTEVVATATVDQALHAGSGAGPNLVIAENVWTGLDGHGIYLFASDDAEVRENRLTGLGGASTSGVKTNTSSSGGRYIGNWIRGFEIACELVNQVDLTVRDNDIDDCDKGIYTFGLAGVSSVRGNRIGSGVGTPYLNVPGSALPTYTPTNVSADRAFNADTVAVAELADVVGTLIADLRLQGIVR